VRRLFHQPQEAVRPISVGGEIRLHVFRGEG
jgi:hypothetical protein